VDSRVERHSGFVFKPENHVQHVLAGWSYVAGQFGRSSLHHADVHQWYCKKSNIARVKSDAVTALLCGEIGKKGRMLNGIVID